MIVLDANVFIKLLLPEGRWERDVEKAHELWDAIRADHVEVLQPVHWLAEIAAVLAELSPKTAADDVRDLRNLHLPVADGPELFRSAIDLSAELDHHMFDTLYHAVALSDEEGLFITADYRYFEKAHGKGHIMMLGDVPYLRA